MNKTKKSKNYITIIKYPYRMKEFLQEIVLFHDVCLVSSLSNER